MENEDKLIEISGGHWETQTMANALHSEVEVEILFAIWNFVKAHNLGRVYPADTSFILEGTVDDIRTMRLPDVAFVAKGKLQERQEGYFFTAPNLAVEIVAPSEHRPKIKKKLLEYLRTGVQQVWLVYPQEQLVEVYSGQSVILYDIEATIPGGEVLPNFSLPVKTIFG